MNTQRTYFVFANRKVREITILSEETHASLKTPYFTYLDVNTQGVGSISPDYIHETKEAAEREKAVFDAAFHKNATSRAIAMKKEQLKTQAYPKNKVEENAPAMVERNLNQLKAGIKKAVGDTMTPKEAFVFFTTYTKIHNALEEPLSFALQHGANALEILQEEIQTKPKKERAPEPPSL